LGLVLIRCPVLCSVYIYIHIYIYKHCGGGTFAWFCLQTLFSRPTRRLIVRVHRTRVRVCLCRPTHTRSEAHVYVYVFIICCIVPHTWEFCTTAGINQFQGEKNIIITVRPGSRRYNYYFQRITRWILYGIKFVFLDLVKNEKFKSYRFDCVLACISYMRPYTYI